MIAPHVDRHPTSHRRCTFGDVGCGVSWASGAWRRLASNSSIASPFGQEEEDTLKQFFVGCGIDLTSCDMNGVYTNLEMQFLARTSMKQKHERCGHVSAHF